MRAVSLSPRLLMAAQLLGEHNTVADVGTDHGRLAISLIQKGYAKKVIATDIAIDPLDRAKSFIGYCKMSDRIETRLGGGLSPIAQNEVDAIAICGMGGELIRDILDACETKLMGAKRIVMQPMRGVEELREYLYNNGYRIIEDRIVKEGERYYQVFSAEIGEESPAPENWPKAFFALGMRAFERRDELFSELVRHMLAQHEKRMLVAKGSRGEAVLVKNIHSLESIINSIKGG